MNFNIMIFDIFDFLHIDDVREIVISIQKKKLKISEEKFGDSDFWVVPSFELENSLQKRFRAFYPMFLGILLTALHTKKTQIPILGVRFDDLDLAFEKNGLQDLADSIALGTYRPSAALP